MNYFLTIVSILLETGKNIFSNKFSKDNLESEADICKFNTLHYLGSALILIPFMKSAVLSPFSLMLAIIFAFVTTLSQYFYMKGLKSGSMAYSTFFLSSGLMIPALCGIIIWGEPIKIHQILSLPILIIAMLLVLKNDNARFSFKWLFFAVMAMIFCGLIGILQSVHQGSDYRGELTEFLVYSFTFMVIINAIFCTAMSKTKNKASFKISSVGVVATTVISGIFMGVVNLLNLYLAGVMPKVVFFPLVNGGLVFVSLLAAVIIFKEKLTAKQWIGMATGIFALCLLSI